MVKHWGNFSRKIKCFIGDEEGQATLEYILILSVIVGAGGFLMRGIYAAVDRGILVFGKELEKNLKTGRISETIWRDEP